MAHRIIQRDFIAYQKVPLVGKIRAMSLFYKSIDNQLNKINEEHMTTDQKVWAGNYYYGARYYQPKSSIAKGAILAKG